MRTLYLTRGPIALVRVVLAACCLVGAGTIWLFSPLRARADGGAPNLAYVAGAGPHADELDVIDIGQRRVTAHISLGGGPAGVVLSTDGRYAYVTQSSLGRLAIVDTRNRRTAASLAVGTQPTALAVAYAQTATELYVVDSGADAVTVVNADSQRVLATISVGKRPDGVAVAGPDSGISNPNDAEIYVANSGSNSVTVLSATQQRAIATIPVPASPLSICVPATGGVAYVATAAGNVLALGLADHRLLGTILRAPGGRLGAMDYDAVTGQVFVPDAATGVVDVLAPVSGSDSGASIPSEPARVLHVSGGPAAVAITFEGSFGFVASRDAGQVTMFDASNHQLLATIGVGGTPRAIVTGPYPPAVSGQTAFLIDLGVVVLIVGLMGWAILSGVRMRRTSRRHAPKS